MPDGFLFHHPLLDFHRLVLVMDCTVTHYHVPIGLSHSCPDNDIPSLLAWSNSRKSLSFREMNLLSER